MLQSNSYASFSNTSTGNEQAKALEELWYTVGKLEQAWGMKFDKRHPAGGVLVGAEMTGYRMGRNAHKWA